MKNANGIEMEEVHIDHETFNQAFTEYFRSRGKRLESIGSRQGQTGYQANVTPVTPERLWVRIERAGGNSVEVTEEEYWEALEVLPPIYLYERNSSAFAMSEAHSHDHNNDPVYFCFCKQADKYFGCLATLAEAQEKFKADLRRGDTDGVLIEGTVQEFTEAADSGQMISLFDSFNNE